MPTAPMAISYGKPLHIFNHRQDKNYKLFILSMPEIQDKGSTSELSLIDNCIAFMNVVLAETDPHHIILSESESEHSINKGSGVIALSFYNVVTKDHSGL